MVNRAILVMLVGVLLGCAMPVNGMPESYELRLDPGLTPAQTDLVLDAYKAWHVEAGAVTAPVVSAEQCQYRDGDKMGCIHVRYGSVADATAMCGGTMMANYERAGCTRTEKINGYVWAAEIVLTDQGEYTINHEIALHEAGHAFGLAHDRAGTLMAPSSDIGYPDITELDVMQYDRVHGGR